MAKEVKVSDLITDVKLWKKDWESTVATGHIVLGGCIQVDVRLIKYGDGYFVSWPRRKSVNKDTGEDEYFDQVKPIGDDGKISKELGNEISKIVTKAYTDMDDDIPF